MTDIGLENEQVLPQVDQEIHKYDIDVPLVQTNRLEAVINKLLKREQRPEDPETHFSIHYGSHLTRKDAEDIAQRLAACDIYIPENVGWTPAFLQLLDDVSQGKKTPADVRIPQSYMSEFMKRHIEIIYNSKKPITAIDIPQEDLRDYQSYPVRLTERTTFKDVLKDTITQKKAYQEANIDRRGEYMLTQLKPKIEEVLRKNPDLVKRVRNKGSLEVFLSLGAAHMDVYQKLAAEGVDVDRHLQDGLIIFPIREELNRRLQYDKEVSDELVAQAFLETSAMESFLRSQPSFRPPDAVKFTQFYREAITGLSLEAIEGIFEEWKANSYSSSSLLELLQQRGIPAPTSDEIIDSFLAQAHRQKVIEVNSTNLDRIASLRDELGDIKESQ